MALKAISGNFVLHSFQQKNGKIHPLNALPRSQLGRLPFNTWKAVMKRNQFVAAKQIIICIISVGLVLMSFGAAITAVAFVYYKDYNWLYLTGPCVIVCGALIMLLSIELCYKRKRTAMVEYSEDMLDEHTIPDSIQRYGFGNYKPNVLEKSKEKNMETKIDGESENVEANKDEQPDKIIVANSVDSIEANKDEQPDQIIDTNSVDNQNTAVKTEVAVASSIKNLKEIYTSQDKLEDLLSPSVN